jgi:hypothetical protein
MALKNRRTQKNKTNRVKRGGKKVGKKTKKSLRNKKRQSRRRRMRRGGVGKPGPIHSVLRAPKKKLNMKAYGQNGQNGRHYHAIIINKIMTELKKNPELTDGDLKTIFYADDLTDDNIAEAKRKLAEAKKRRRDKIWEMRLARYNNEDGIIT